jgi:hypothetical protein
MIALLQTSGYLRCPDAITEELLERTLLAQPELIEEWVLLSLDKRTSEGWYLLRPGTQSAGPNWEVGYHPRPGRQSFPNAARACAFFVKREVEQIRSFIEKPHP